MVRGEVVVVVMFCWIPVKYASVGVVSDLASISMKSAI